MRQRHPPIGKRAIQGCGRHQLPMGGERWQWTITPLQPLLQLGCHRKTLAQTLPQRSRGSQGKLPTQALTHPTASGADASQLGLRYRIKWTHHLDQTGWRQIQTAANRL